MILTKYGDTYPGLSDLTPPGDLIDRNLSISLYITIIVIHLIKFGNTVLGLDVEPLNSALEVWYSWEIFLFIFRDAMGGGRFDMTISSGKRCEARILPSARQ